MNNQQRSVLGKGLAALMPSISEINSSNSSGQENVKEVAIDSIKANREQPRQSFDQRQIEELSASIRQHGLLQPLLVTTEGDHYKLIAGERRLRACVLAEITKVPVVIKNVDKKDVLSLSIIENIQRQNLSPIEEARAYKRLVEENNYTQEELSEILSKSRSHIANYLRLLHLPKLVQELLSNKQITMGHAKVLANAADPEAVAKKVVADGMSVRQCEDYVRNLHRGLVRTSDATTLGSIPENRRNLDKKYDDSAQDPDIISIEKSLSEALYSKVRIVKGALGGQILIDFYNLEHMDAIASRLSLKPLDYHPHNKNESSLL